jgi:serine/threonine protein kinase
MSDVQTIGPYNLLEQVGAGGMATVYKAYQPKLDRYVALKMMHRMFLDDKNFVARFEREAKIVGQLDHKNIVPIYDYSVHNNQPYLVMKYIDGRTLKDHMQEDALTLEEIRHVMRDICDALTYAHQKGVFHRDIKPSNIIIDAQGIPYLTDFGLARVAQRGESTLSVDSMLGTPHYISPEQAQGGAIDARTDVYSTGVLLYELVTGRLPFTGENAYAVVHKQINSLPPRPSELNPDVPLALELVLLKALEKDPTARYNTPNELFAGFENALQVSGMVSLDASRVHRAKQLGELISAKTPNGGAYAPIRENATPSHVVVANGIKSVIVPVLSPETPPLEYTFSEWLEVFIQRIRRFITEFQAQLKERPINERFNDAFNEIGSDVQHVKSVAQHQIKDFTPPARKRYDANRIVGITQHNLSDWEMDENSIRRRARQRVTMRSGFFIHLGFYVVMVLLMFLGKSAVAEVIASGMTEVSAEIALDLGIDAPLVASALAPLASIRVWLVVALLWGSGVMSHALHVFDKTSQLRINQQQRRLEKNMQLVHGVDWRDTASPDNYKRMRKSVERQASKRVGFWSHAVSAVLMIGAIVISVPIVEDVAQQLHQLATGTPIEISDWATLGTLLMLMALFIHSIIYVLSGLFGGNNRELAVQAEISRERKSLSSMDTAFLDKQKRKHDDDFVEDVNIRLTEDGEFSDSFIEEVNQAHHP